MTQRSSINWKTRKKQSTFFKAGVLIPRGIKILLAISAMFSRGLWNNAEEDYLNHSSITVHRSTTIPLNSIKNVGQNTRAQLHRKGLSCSKDRISHGKASCRRREKSHQVTIYQACRSSNCSLSTAHKHPQGKENLQVSSYT